MSKKPVKVEKAEETPSEEEAVLVEEVPVPSAEIELSKEMKAKIALAEEQAKEKKES